MFFVDSKGFSGPLYHKDQIPEHFHESFINKGYRNPKSSPFQCILSVFDATNETLNFWTHFLPSWYFMWVLRGLSDTFDFKSDSFTWPLLAYMCMTCIYPLASAVAHTFNTMSDSARHICFFLDYSAISASALGVAIAYKAYCFPEEIRFTIWGDIYIPVAIVNAVLCITISCQTRLMKPSAFRKVLRIAALGLPCIYSTIPVTYRVMFGTKEASLSSHYYHMLSIIFMYMAGFLYGTHFPERLFPGSFDIVGHSHQLFHVSVILGTMVQMQGILKDMQEQKGHLLQTWEFGDVGSSIGLLLMVLLFNTLVVLLFTVRLICRLKSKHE